MWHCNILQGINNVHRKFFMVANFFLWCLIFLSLYEIAPEQLCRMGEDGLVHFAGKVSCNSGIENFMLFASFISFLLLFFLFRGRKYELVINKKSNDSAVPYWIAFSSTGIVIISAIVLWWKTGFIIIPDQTARSTLVLQYHSVFGHPLIAPFLYISIISTTYIYTVKKVRWLWVLCVLAISFGCYITMSRGFILSVVLPFIVMQPVRHMIRFAPILILIFFLRDILNGSFLNYADPNTEAITVLTSALGEFTNTYFGRRYFIDAEISPDYVIFTVENVLKASGVYYAFSPVFKVLAAVGYEVPSSTQAINDGIEKSLGLTGFAGSFLTDIAIFFPASIFIIFICVSVVFFLYRNLLRDTERFIFLLVASMLLPNAFRWSLTGFLSMLSGILICYCLIKVIFPRKCNLVSAES